MINKGTINKLIFIMLFFSGFLFSYQFQGVLFTQWFSSFAILIYFFFIDKFKFPFIIYYLILIFYLLLVFLLLSYQFKWLNHLQYFRSFINLIFYVLVFYIFVEVGFKINRRFFINLIKFIFITVFLLQLLQFIFLQFNIFITYTTENIWISDDIYHSLFSNGITRSRAFFGEPSWLAIVMFGLIVALKLLKEDNFFLIILFFISEVLTLSLTGFLSIFLYVLMNFKKMFNNLFKVKYFIFFSILFFSSLILYSVLENNKLFIYLIERIDRVFSGNDMSVFIRYIYSFNFTKVILRTSPIIGVGVGNVDVFSNYIGYYNYYLPGIGYNYNDTYQYLLATFGILGMFIVSYILYKIVKLNFIYSNKRNNRIIILFLIFYFFVSGLFLSPLFWYMFAIIIISNNLNFKEKN